MVELLKISDCKFDQTDFTISHKDLSTILGDMILNRVSGIIINNFKKVKNADLPKEVWNLFNAMNLFNIKKTIDFFNNLKYLSGILRDLTIPYAFLKGTYLATNFYNIGERTSNDIDILVSPEHISQIQQILTKNGFIQGRVESGKIIPASRKEIILSRMNNGETIPFVKIFRSEFITVDLNFSIDYKASSDKSIIIDMLNNIQIIQFEDFTFPTLSDIYFITHLCCHLYKEATTYNWVNDRSDLKLYKFCDINLLIHRLGNPVFLKKLANTISKLGLKNECYYAVENTSLLFPNLNSVDGFIDFKMSIKPNDITYMNKIVSPQEKKIFQHHMNFIDWFFCTDRIIHLEEIHYGKN